jgi:hypothetical protein
MTMASEEPEIAATVSFRHPALKLRDEVIGEHKSGYLEQKVERKRGKAPERLPPQPDGPAPKTSFSARLYKRLVGRTS